MLSAPCDCAADDFLNCEEKFVDKLHASLEKRDGYCINTSLHIRVCEQWRLAWELMAPHFLG